MNRSRTDPIMGKPSSTPPTEPNSSSSLRETVFWWGAWALLLGLCLWPVWTIDMVPYQDYAAHLFQVDLLYSLSTRGGWPPAGLFSTHLHVAPYCGYYLATLLFHGFAPVETAGRLFLTLYFAVVGLLVVVCSGKRADRFPVAGAFLFFPFAMNQQYLLGNTNFFLSIPLLMFLLLSFEKWIGKGFSFGGAAKQWGWQTVVFLFHPLTFLAGVGLTAAAALFHSLRKRDFRFLWAPAFGVVFYLAFSFLDSASDRLSGGGWYWRPLKDTAIYFLEMFAGFRLLDGVQIIYPLAWLLLAVALGLSMTIRKAKMDTRFRTTAFFLALTLAAMIVLPFGKKPAWTFVNMRLASVVYFLLALLFAQVTLRGKAKFAVAGACILLTFLLAVKERKIAAELSPLAPVLEEIPKGARVLPLIEDRSSPEVDGAIFEPLASGFHYLFIRRRPVAFPYFLESPLMPVSLKTTPPAPPLYDMDAFSWERDGAFYNYFLLRGASPKLLGKLRPHARLLRSEGSWFLYQKR